MNSALTSSEKGFYTSYTSAGPIELKAVVLVPNKTEPISDASLTLDVEAALSLQEAAVELGNLLTPGYAHAKAVKQAIGFLDNAAKAKDTAKAVDYVLKATDQLLGITDPAVVAARAKLGFWLKANTVGLPVGHGS